MNGRSVAAFLSTSNASGASSSRHCSSVLLIFSVFSLMVPPGYPDASWTPGEPVDARPSFPVFVSRQPETSRSAHTAHRSSICA